MKKDRNKKHLIINKKLTLSYRFRDTILTLLLWGVWLYIFYPLFAMICWKLFSVNIFYNFKEVSQIENFAEVLKDFLIYSTAIIVFLSVSFIGWGYYNKKRFSAKGNKRRNMPKPVTTQMLADSLRVDPKAIDTCKKTRYVQIYHTSSHPRSKEGVFKPVNDLHVSSVNLFFSDNWGKIREESNFGYTHIREEKGDENFYNEH